MTATITRGTGRSGSRHLGVGEELVHTVSTTCCLPCDLPIGPATPGSLGCCPSGHSLPGASETAPSCLTQCATSGSGDRRRQQIALAYPNGRPWSAAAAIGTLTRDRHTGTATPGRADRPGYTGTGQLQPLQPPLRRKPAICSASSSARLTLRELEDLWTRIARLVQRE